MTDQKTPPSEMIRVPTALIPAVKELSKLHRQGHTIALMQALEDLITQFDSKIDSDITSSSFAVKQLEEKLETKLDTITKKLEQMERAITSLRYNNNTRPRRQVYSHQQPQVELLPRTNENLAQRLGVTPQSLIAEKEKLTPKEFISWSRNRDPMSTGWEYHPNDGLYHPVK
jgi:FtsZ-binding cell division protein ZapB